MKGLRLLTLISVAESFIIQVMAKKAEVWRRRHEDEVAGRKAAYYKTPEQLAEEAEVDEDNPDDKDIYDTGDNVRLMSFKLPHSYTVEYLWLTILPYFGVLGPPDHWLGFVPVYYAIFFEIHALHFIGLPEYLGFYF